MKLILEDELLHPQLKKNPQIRQVCAEHPFASDVRRDLDSECNEVTREMTRHFMETYEGGVFTGWRCSYDCAMGRPLNPDILVGEDVAKVFGGVLCEGMITNFKNGGRPATATGTERISTSSS